MANKTYYGEYTLKHWIKLMVSKNIELPWFQRAFIWDEKKASELIDSLKNEYYIPPVTIGFYAESETTKHNLIIDGQQRLTSILLAYLEKFPKKEEFIKKEIEDLANGQAEDVEASEEDSVSQPIEWTFNEIIKDDITIDNLKKSIQGNPKYKDFNNSVNDDFFEKTFLGFNFILPAGDSTAQQKFYASVFRNINIKGKNLTTLEARQSLYFTEPSLKYLFAPDELKEYYIKSVDTIHRLDFVRYLAILSQYYNTQNAKTVARGYYNDMEKYYMDFLSLTVSEKQTTGVDNTYSKIFEKDKFEIKYKRLLEILNWLNIPKQLQSIIDMDLWFFGLIYYVIFRDKTFTPDKLQSITRYTNREISNTKDNGMHKSYPALISRVRNRLENSIAIFRRYATSVTS